MKTNLLFYVSLILLPLSVFGNYGDASLQIDFNNRSQYLIQIGNEEFSTRGGSITVDHLNSGFYPVHIYQMNGRQHRLLYAGGVNLAAASITYSRFFRGNLMVTEVIPFYANNYAVMNDAEFSRFLYSVADESFDSSRLDLMKMQLQYQYFTSMQVAQIMEEFAFDSNRLEFAKLAFLKTVDPQNYYCVTEKLTFSSSRKELNQYILSVSN